MGLPPPAPLLHDDVPLLYFLVEDDAFPLLSYMMKPFSHLYLSHQDRIFNYHLSRARRVVENAFGILANGFRCLLTTIATTPETAMKITKACIVMHNLMRNHYPYLQNGDLDIEREAGVFVPGAWRERAMMVRLEAIGRGAWENREGKEQRIVLKHYYNSEVGSVPWQDDMVN